MLLHDIKKRKRIKTGLLVCLYLTLNACSTDLSYVSREQIRSNAFASVKPNYIDKKPLYFGAIRLTSKDAKEGELGQVFILQRKKGVYMAETMVKDAGKQRYFMSVGVDSRNKTPALNFRMEF